MSTLLNRMAVDRAEKLIDRILGARYLVVRLDLVGSRQLREGVQKPSPAPVVRRTIRVIGLPSLKARLLLKWQQLNPILKIRDWINETHSARADFAERCTQNLAILTRRSHVSPEEGPRILPVATVGMLAAQGAFAGSKNI